MKRILVIEDNELNLYLVNFILKRDGHEVIEARTGEKGAELAIIEKPDLILMDIQLPGIGGLEATRRIRKSEAEVPIIALSSYAMTGNKDKSLAAGCTGFLEKPINPETFMGEIDKYL
jgi:CheY-like chemotaxis protein